MKKLAAIMAFAFLLPAMLWAQAPESVSYQAVARDGNGNPLASKSISVRMTIRNLAASGAVVYQETHVGVSTNQFGLFTLQIGRGNVVSGTFSGIDWSTGAKYAQVEFDPNNGSAYIDMGSTELLSVPYALYAGKSGGDSLTINGNQLSIVGGNTVILPGGGGGGGDNWGTQTVITNSTLTGSGTALAPLGLAQQGATAGQALKWNGISWSPMNDNNTDAQTLSISGNTLTLTNGGSVALPTGADNWGTQTALTDNTTIAGTGVTGNAIRLAQNGASNGQVLKWNGSAWAPAADTDTDTNTDAQQLSINGNTLSLTNGGTVTLPSSGGGDNWGTQTAVTDGTVIIGTGISGNAIRLSQNGASNGQVLKWNGSAWAPSTDNGGPSYTSGTGINITGGNQIVNTAPDQTVTLSATGASTVTGSYPNFTINTTSNSYTAGTGINISGANVITNTAPGVTYAAGTGINITGGNIINNTAPDQTVTLTGGGSTTVSGSYPNFTVSSSGTTYTAGTGISISGTTISSTVTGDQTVSLTGTGATSVSGTYPNFTINSTDNNTTYSAGQGLALTGTTFSLSQNGASNGQVLQWNGTGWVPTTPAAGAAGWSLTGNASTTAGTNFIGTTDAVDFVVKTNNAERVRVNSTGNVGIGVTNPLFLIHASGSAGANSSINVVSNTNAAGSAVSGQNTAAVGSSTGNGVTGLTQQSQGVGIYGANLNTNGTGVLGVGNNVATYALPNGGAGGAFYGLTGVYGFSNRQVGYGVNGRATNKTYAFGVVGVANATQGAGPGGVSNGAGGAFSGGDYGVSGVSMNQDVGIQCAGGYFVSGYDTLSASPLSTTLVEAFSVGGSHYKIWNNQLGAVSTCVPDLNGNPATLHAIETPEFYFQDYGQAQLVNGRAHITIDPILAKNVAINDKHPLRVFVQLEGDCNGVYVTNKTATGFDVVELSGGKSNVTFQWSITCNVADAKIGNRISPFADLRFEPGPVSQMKNIGGQATTTLNTLKK